MNKLTFAAAAFAMTAQATKIETEAGQDYVAPCMGGTLEGTTCTCPADKPYFAWPSCRPIPECNGGEYTFDADYDPTGQNGYCQCPDGKWWDMNYDDCVGQTWAVGCIDGEVVDNTCVCAEGLIADWSGCREEKRCEGGTLQQDDYSTSSWCQCPENTMVDATENYCVPVPERGDDVCVGGDMSQGWCQCPTDMPLLDWYSGVCKPAPSCEGGMLDPSYNNYCWCEWPQTYNYQWGEDCMDPCPITPRDCAPGEWVNQDTCSCEHLPTMGLVLMVSDPANDGNHYEMRVGDHFTVEERYEPYTGGWAQILVDQDGYLLNTYFYNTELKYANAGGWSETGHTQIFETMAPVEIEVWYEDRNAVPQRRYKQTISVITDYVEPIPEPMPEPVPAPMPEPMPMPETEEPEFSGNYSMNTPF